MVDHDALGVKARSRAARLREGPRVVEDLRKPLAWPMVRSESMCEVAKNLVFGSLILCPTLDIQK